MVKKMKLPFLRSSSSSSSSSPSSSWPWPSCHQPRTISFRDTNATNSDPTSLDSALDPVETVVRGLRSDRRRLFFEPDETSSILESTTKASSSCCCCEGGVPFKDSFGLCMDSRDPYLDFRRSMEEMVEAHDLRHSQALQQLLCCYLRLNAKSNHVSILAAFVDLLLDLSPPTASSFSSSSSSLASSFTTKHCLRCVTDHDHRPSTYASLSQQVIDEDTDLHDNEASSSLNA